MRRCSMDRSRQRGIGGQRRAKKAPLKKNGAVFSTSVTGRHKREEKKKLIYTFDITMTSY
jgi:hypothetical protein